MKFFLAPQCNDFLDDFGAVFPGSIAITVDHGQIAYGKLETEFCGFFGHGDSLEKKPTLSTAKTTAAISNSRGESSACTGHVGSAASGGKLGGLLEAKQSIKASCFSLKSSI